MKNLFDIKDKVVVITGGTGVLGKAIAFHLAEEGRHFGTQDRNRGRHCRRNQGKRWRSHVPDNRRDEP